jgi:DNA-binding NarL/FixJ family response regulator
VSGQELIRVLVVDDHTLFREGVMSMLDNCAETVAIGGAGSGREAIEQAALLQPDVILMDIMMPDMNGNDAMRAILADWPQVKVVMLTMLEDDDSLFTAMCNGARGYILKGADRDEMIRTIRAVVAGEALFGQPVAERIVGFFRHAAYSGTQQQQPFAELTSREREVLELISIGLSNREIADRLFISGKTVSNHITSIFDKLQVADRAQAIVKARHAGLGDDAM